ncbi:MAG TPA: tripartite tricarboxylate transporter TctB family protein [Candidatus Methylomirabilis sp.]|nr:tripartite tricarboxylate transporter TctB family protein [Candidatus Methylomirabilis sp.]
MRKADAIVALIILAIGIVVLYDAVRLGIFGWTISGPAPGMYVGLLGTGVTVGSLLILWQTFRKGRKGAPNKPFIQPGGLKPVLYVSVPAAVMVLLTEFIGIYIAAGLYLAIYMRWIGSHRWITVAAVSILVPLVSYIVFERIFLIPLPKGMFEEYLSF